MFLYKPVGPVHKNVEFMMAGHERLERRDMYAIAGMFATTIVTHGRSGQTVFGPDQRTRRHS
jgi:hypothetical protein